MKTVPKLSSDIHTLSDSLTDRGLTLVFLCICSVYSTLSLKVVDIHINSPPFMKSFWYSENKRNEPREKTGLRGFRPGPTQTRLYSYRRWLEA